MGVIATSGDRTLFWPMIILSNMYLLTYIILERLDKKS